MITEAHTARIDESRQNSSIFSAISYLLAGSDSNKEDLSKESMEADHLTRECIKVCKVQDIFIQSE